MTPQRLAGGLAPLGPGTTSHLAAYLRCLTAEQLFDAMDVSEQERWRYDYSRLQLRTVRAPIIVTGRGVVRWAAMVELHFSLLSGAGTATVGCYHAQGGLDVSAPPGAAFTIHRLHP